MSYTKTVWNPGGPPGISAPALMNIENGLESIIGKDNTSVVETTSVKLETDTRSTVLTYTGGLVTKEEVKNGSTIMKTTTLNYDGSGNLTSEVVTANGKTITTTITYDGSGNVTGTTKTVV